MVSLMMHKNKACALGTLQADKILAVELPHSVHHRIPSEAFSMQEMEEEKGDQIALYKFEKLL